MGKPLIFAIGVVATILTSVSTALVWVLAVSLAPQQSTLSGLAFSAASLCALGLFSIAFVLARLFCSTEHDTIYTTAEKGMNIFSIIITAISALLTLGLLLWLELQPIATTRIVDRHTSDLVAIELALWTMSIITSTTFFAINMAKQATESRRRTVMIEDVLNNTQEIQAIAALAAPYRFGGVRPQHSTSSSPSLSTFSSDSFHLSFKPFPVLAHSSSMTALVPHAAPVPETTHFDPVPAPDLSQYKHFDSDASTRSFSSGRLALSLFTKLEPIPGSRPASGADLLKGPFPQDAVLEEPLGRRNNVRSHSVCSLEPEVLIVEKPKVLRRRSRSVPSRRSSFNESHIHPLFRTDSPLPSPTPTLGTTVIASAFGGQCMSAKSITRATSRSPYADAPSSTAFPLDDSTAASQQSTSLPSEYHTGEPQTKQVLVPSNEIQTACVEIRASLDGTTRGCST